MRDIVKVRKVGETLVVTLTQTVLADVDLKEGDRVVIEPVPPRRVILTKETKSMSNTHRAALEIALLERKRDALESEMNFVGAQRSLHMPIEPGMGDLDVADLRLKNICWDRDKVEVQLAEKRLEMFELEGAAQPSEVPVGSDDELTVSGEVIGTIGQDLGLRVDDAEVVRTFWLTRRLDTKLNWLDGGAPVVSIGRAEDIAKCRPGDRASLTLVVEQRKGGKRGTKTVRFEIEPKP